MLATHGEEPAARLEYDPFSSAVQEDPYPYYDALLAGPPLWRSEARDLLVLPRFDDVEAALRDWRRCSSSAGVRQDDLLELQGPSIIAMDPPRHRELRRVVQPAFSGESLARLEQSVTRRAGELLDAFDRCGDLDVAELFAKRLPVLVICDLMGLPAGDGPMLKTWADEMVSSGSALPGAAEAGRAAAEQLRSYFSAELARRRNHPQDDLLSRLATARACGTSLSPDEEIGMCNLLFEAGNATTSGLIGNGLCALAEHPAQREWLVRNPGAMAGAVEELLRFDGPLQNLARVAIEPFDLHGTPVPAGASLLLVLGAANRDPRAFQDPNELHLDRAPRRHVAFGTGVHSCVGAPLARLEGRIALGLFLERMPRYELVERERLRDLNLRTMTRLVVRPAGR